MDDRTAETGGATEASPAGRLVVRNFLTLGSGELGSKVLAFGVTIYLARVLGADAYGVVGFALAVTLYLWTVVEAGVELGGPRHVAATPERRHALASAVVAVRLGLAAVLALVTAVLSLTLLPRPEATVLAAYGLTLLPIAAGTRWVHLGLERSRPVAISRVAAEAIRLLAVLLLVRGAADVLRVPIAHFLGEAAAALLLAVWLLRGRRRPPLWPDWGAARTVFTSSLPLMGAGILGLLAYNADLIFLRVLGTRADVGHYLAAYALITFVGGLAHVTRLSLIPTLSRVGPFGEEGRALAETAVARVFALGLPIAAGGFLLAPGIIDFVFGAEYAVSVPVLELLIWTVPPLLVRGVVEAGLIAREGQVRVLRLTAWGAGVNVALNAVLIPLLGLMGAALATLGAELVRLVVAWVYVWKEGFRIAPPGRLWRAAVATAAMTGALIPLDSVPVWLAVPLGAACYGAALAAAGGLRFRRDRGVVLKV